jgi:DNA-binding beta-propeller fold protein YncE
VWLEGSISPITPIFNGLSDPYSLFVTITGEIYVDNGDNGRVDKSTLNATQSITVMNVVDHCFSLFVDINDNLYCSMYNKHQVIKHSLSNIANPSKIVAGDGSSGSLSNKLSHPRGIFVDINFDLYVADSDNNRIQLFKPGEFNAATLFGNGTPGLITLDEPSGIVLDVDKYLFIADRDHHRIIGQDLNGFRCLVGCSGSSGSKSTELNSPFTLSFDSYGNMFIADQKNSRIQKFILSTNSCGKCLKIFE